MNKALLGAIAYGLALLTFLFFLAIFMIVSSVSFSVMQLVLLSTFVICVAYFAYVALKLITAPSREPK